MRIQRRAQSSGVTLIEVVVSLLVLSVGAIALAGTLSAVARMVDSGVSSTRLAALITEIIETRLAAPCGAAAGRERRANLEVRWTVTVVPGGQRITLTAVSPAPGPRPPLTITRFVACPG